MDFGSTLAIEKLAERDGWRVSRETVRGCATTRTDLILQPVSAAQIGAG